MTFTSRRTDGYLNREHFTLSIDVRIGPRGRTTEEATPFLAPTADSSRLFTTSFTDGVDHVDLQGVGGHQTSGLLHKINSTLRAPEELHWKALMRLGEDHRTAVVGKGEPALASRASQCDYGVVTSSSRHGKGELC